MSPLSGEFAAQWIRCPLSGEIRPLVGISAVVALTLAVVVISLGMIPCIQKVQFAHLFIDTHGPIDGRTDRPSYRDTFLTDASKKANHAFRQEQ